MKSLSAIAIVLSLAGCGSNAEQDPGGTSSADCASLIATCVENQQQCVSDAKGAHCEPCAEGKYAANDGVCKPLVGTEWSHDFPEHSTQPGDEIVGECRSWTLGNDAELWVNAVELSQDEASHHSNWTFVPDDQFDGPDGLWPCKDRSYDQLKGALAGGVIYAQSTQAKREVQKFPDGVVVRIPPHSRIISDVHVLNTTTKPVTGHVKMTLYALDPADVQVKLAPFHVSYDGLDIPPHATSRFFGQCELDSKFQGITKAPMASKIYYVLPHTHAMGSRFFLSIDGGPSDGQSIIDVHGFNGEARGRRYDPPIDLGGATGLSFGCEFTNQRDVSVGWGFGDQEMCEALGFAEADVAFESRVSEAVPAGADGTTQTFTGACETIAFSWSQEKPGGAP